MTTEQEQLTQDEHAYLMATSKRLPITIRSGHGSTVTDASGREYLDLVAGIAVNILGHGHPAVTRAIADQSARLIHTSNLYYTEPQVELAKLLVGHAFPSRVFFANSGAEANEAAIKIARKWGKLHRQGAFRIITAERSFHGRTLATVTATGQPKYQAPFAPVPEGFDHVPYGDLEAVKRATGKDTVAVMLEPMIGESGVLMTPEGFFSGVREWCDEQDLLLILDEVQTGICRTGDWFAYQHEGITPDVMTLAKALGGGVPIGACLAAPRADVLEPGDHGSTFGGNPLACAAGVAVLRVAESEDLPGHAREMGGLLREQLESLSGVKEVRGRGLLQAVEFEAPVAKDFEHQCLDLGLLINATDEHTIRFAPPLVITAGEIDRAGATMRQAQR
ncbi:MAG: acetylornithine transaminase [Candidatus Dormibacteraceae bacterium]